MALNTLLDLALLCAVIITATGALHARDLFAGVVLYVGFGLSLSIVWVRLLAPDLALAEAAIGAGITGALLLDTARETGSDPARQQRDPFTLPAAITIGILFLGAVVGIATLTPSAGGNLAERVVESVDLTGMKHPITAVLLDFRGYDTLLEMGVLLAASLGILVLRRSDAAPLTGALVPGPMARTAVSLVIPIGVLVAGYLLWRGTSSPGGAFPAGAIAGALGLMYALVHGFPLADLRPTTLRAILTAGFASLLALGLIGWAFSGIFLRHPEPFRMVLIVGVEITIAISIAATLLMLYAGGQKLRGREGGAE